MKNYWLQRRNPLLNITVLDENGKSQKVPLFTRYVGTATIWSTLPSIYYILSTGDLFIYTNTIEQAEQITVQILSKHIPLYIHPVTRYSFYYLSHICI